MQSFSIERNISMNNLSEQNALQTDLRNEPPVNSPSKGKLYVAHKNWALIDFCELHNLHSGYNEFDFHNPIPLVISEEEAMLYDKYY